MEKMDISGSAIEPVVRMEEVESEATTNEQERLHGYLIHLEDGQRALDAAKTKVAQAEADLEGAHEAVRVAEAELATLEGRE